MEKVQQKTLMAVLSYLGILAIIPFLVSKDDPFVKFHLKQGLVLLSIEIIVWLISMATWHLWMLLSIVNLGTLILAIIGIVNVIQGQEKSLPLVGQFSSYFKI